MSSDSDTTSFTTCDLYDEFGEQLYVIGSELSDFGGRTKFTGSAFTVKCFEDNSQVRRAVKSPGNGQVLVVDGGGSRRCALIGDMLAKEAAANGWAGLVIDGSIRDTLELRTLDIGIKARAATPRKSASTGEGQSNISVFIAGVPIKPEDRIFADSDGIIILPT